MVRISGRLLHWKEEMGGKSTDVLALSDWPGEHYQGDDSQTAACIVGLDVEETSWHDAGGAPFKRQHFARQGKGKHWITKPHFAAMSTMDRKWGVSRVGRQGLNEKIPEPER
jgi:hypothetical protein